MRSDFRTCIFACFILGLPDRPDLEGIRFRDVLSPPQSTNAILNGVGMDLFSGQYENGLCWYQCRPPGRIYTGVSGILVILIGTWIFKQEYRNMFVRLNCFVRCCFELGNVCHVFLRRGYVTSDLSSSWLPFSDWEFAGVDLTWGGNAVPKARKMLHSGKDDGEVPFCFRCLKYLLHWKFLFGKISD